MTRRKTNKTPAARRDESRRRARNDTKAKGGGPSRPRRAKTSRRPPKKTAPRSSWRRRLLVWTATFAVWLTVAGGAVLAYFALTLPDIDGLTATTRRPGITFLAAGGETIAAYGDVHGRAVPLAELPPALPRAVMAVEDRRFYDHFGLDPLGIARAMLANLRAGGVVQGGSTLTQQLAKNLFLTHERSLARKLRELLLALWLEHAFSKDQILTLYLNRVYLGAGTYGVEAAAQRYFGRSARDLTLYQSAMIAGLLKAPSRYNPLRDPEAARARTAVVLRAMVDAGYITANEAAAARRQGPGRLNRPPGSAHYFTVWLLDRVPDFGARRDADLVVRTTLDLEIQRAAEQALARALDGPGRKAGVTQGAVVVLSPDGAVRAMVGGRSYAHSQFNRAVQARRQPGSAFKPFVYLAALEAGMSPDDVVPDAPVTIGEWSPDNFSRGHRGPVSLREALARSINTVAVRLSERVGRQRVIAVARRLGLTSRLPDHPSLALGTGEVSPLELASAYAVLANGGGSAWPYGVRAIADRSGHEIYRRQGSGAGRLVAPAVLADINAMLRGVVEAGTGRRAALDRPAAGKTGTTQDHRDAWFVGYTADYVAAVWLGNDDASPMKGVTGGSLPAEIWREVMTAAHRGLPPAPLPGAETPSAGEDDPWQRMLDWLGN